MKRAVPVPAVLFGLLLAASLSAAPEAPLAATAPPPGTPNASATSPQGPVPAPTATPLAPSPPTPADAMLTQLSTAPLSISSWQEALQLLKTRSTSLRSAYAQIEVARGRARMTLASSLPRLTATGTLSHQLITEDIGGTTAANFFPPTVVTGRMDLVAPLLSVRNWYDYATGQHSIEKAKLDASEAERLVIAGLAEAIVLVITNERLAEVTRLNLKTALTNLELNRRRSELGAGTQLDVLRAEQEVEESRKNLIEADESLFAARDALGETLGENGPVGVVPTIRLDQVQLDARSSCEARRDLRERADQRSARKAVEIAERNVTSVDYSFLPTLNAQSSFVVSSNLFSTGSRGPFGWSIGGVLSWPLYEGGLRYGERQQNQGLLQIARDDARSAELTAQTQVRKALREVDTAELKLATADRSRKVAEETARLARVRFESGSGTSFDLVDTQEKARKSELDLTVKEFELVRARIVAFLALSSCHL